MRLDIYENVNEDKILEAIGIKHYNKLINLT